MRLIRWLTAIAIAIVAGMFMIATPALATSINLKADFTQYIPSSDTMAASIAAQTGTEVTAIPVARSSPITGHSMAVDVATSFLTKTAAVTDTGYAVDSQNGMMDQYAPNQTAANNAKITGAGIFTGSMEFTEKTADLQGITKGTDSAAEFNFVDTACTISPHFSEVFFF